MLRTRLEPIQLPSFSGVQLALIAFNLVSDMLMHGFRRRKSGASISNSGG